MCLINAGSSMCCRFIPLINQLFSQSNEVPNSDKKENRSEISLVDDDKSKQR